MIGGNKMGYRYYKIIYNQKVIDVNTDFLLNFINYKPRSKSLMLCKQNENPIGIVASDNSEIYHVEGWNEIPVNVIGDFKTVTLIEIDEEEYIALKTALDENKIIIEPEPEPEPEPEKSEEEFRAETEYLNSLQFVKDSKINYMSYLCQKIIEDGIDVKLSDGETYHFALTKEDQINLIECQAFLSMGATQVSYHADDRHCDYYSAEDMTKIILASIEHKEYHKTYFNSLKFYINSMDNIVDISNIYYGIEIPKEHQSVVYQDLLKKIQLRNEETASI